MALPVGTVTFLFTDIEGSTQLWEKHPEAMRSLLANHDAILKEAVEANHGHIIKTTGDGIHAAFEHAIDAVHSAVEAQRGLQTSEVSPLRGQVKSSEVSIHVRMGIHTGEAEFRDNDYYGQTLNRAVRVMSAGNGGQVLVSEVTAEIVRDELTANISLRDMGEHHLKGLLRPEHIYQIDAVGLEHDFPPLQSLPTKTNNLPPALTSFIGRERELAEVKQKLQDARLLTLIGPGGTGKTRLSLQLATEVLSAFQDGVWLIELAPLADTGLVLQTIAGLFSLRQQVGMPLKDIVCDYLRAKNLLLILDNCEHLIEETAQITDQILHNSPNVKILASSREALGINGETVYRVPSLSLPDQAEVKFEALMGYESVRLLVDRARAANPKFDLTDKNASSVAQICRRLDGIPLALELAAARVTVFSAEQIAARLDDRFKLLTGGSRTALPRQQTLRALIDWSYDILSDEECILLRRLSVFAGGWIFEAAEALCPDLDVLNLLTQLINKSLVAVEENENGSRYRLLETVRQYARDKLLESGEAEQVRNVHLEYYVRFAEIAGPQMDGPEVLEWIPVIDAEHDNLRTAFEWGLDHDIEAALRVVGELAYFWFRHGHGAEGIQWANAALEKADQLPQETDPNAQLRQKRVRANALQALSFLAYSQGDNLNAFRAADQCILLARELNEKRLLAVALGFSGSSKLFMGELAEGEARIEEAVALTRAANERYGLGVAMGMLAQVAAMKKGDFTAAKTFEQEALALVGESGNQWMSIMMLFGTGRGAMFRGDYDIARERFLKCLPIFIEMGDVHRANMVHSELAHMDRYEGKYEKAEDEYRKTIRVWQKLGHRAAVAHQLESFAFIAKVREKMDRAVRLLGAAEILRERINIPMSPPERVEYEREMADLRTNMDGALFKSIWVEGRTMSMEQAVEFALQTDTG